MRRVSPPLATSASVDVETGETPSLPGVGPAALDLAAGPGPEALPLLATVAGTESPAGSPPVGSPVGERASPAQIKDLTAIFRERKLAPAAPPASPLIGRREALLREVLAVLGPLPEAISTATARGLRARVEGPTSEAWLQRWKELDGALQVDLLTMLGALARALQEALGGVEYPRETFLRLVEHSQRERPGYTHGLANKHEPRQGSWLADARQAERTLRDWHGDRGAQGEAASSSSAPVAPAPSPTPPVLLVAAEDEASPVVSDEDAVSLLEADWPWWSQVRGKRAVLVGGSPREPYRQRLNEVFGFSSLDWVDGHVRRISKLASRVAHRGVDLILVVSAFISHKSSSKIVNACKQQGVTFAVLERGHGVLAVRRAVERFVPCLP